MPYKLCVKINNIVKLNKKINQIKLKKMKKKKKWSNSRQKPYLKTFSCNPVHWRCESFVISLSTNCLTERFFVKVLSLDWFKFNLV